MKRFSKKQQLSEEEIRAIESCKTLPSDMVQATDFDAEEAIDLDYSIELPENFSLGKWIYKTSNQGSLGACTSLGTSHSVQILNVKKGGVEPTTSNIITPMWKDLWAKMGHSITQYDGGDYVENAVATALKQGILIAENGQLAKFDAYATDLWNRTDADIEKIKRYIYKGCPIVWCVQGDKTTWNEMTKGEVKTVPAKPTGGHCIALVGWDKQGFWFINSWSANDTNKRKSRFHVSYQTMKDFGYRFNFRYWVLYIKEDAKVDPEYLKRKNVALLVLKVLKKQYNNEPKEVKSAIVTLSQALRKAYPEINEDLPL